MIRFKTGKTGVLLSMKEMAEFVIDIGQVEEKSTFSQRHTKQIEVYIRCESSPAKYG